MNYFAPYLLNSVLGDVSHCNARRGACRSHKSWHVKQCNRYTGRVNLDANAIQGKPRRARRELPGNTCESLTIRVGCLARPALQHAEQRSWVSLAGRAALHGGHRVGRHRVGRVQGGAAGTAYPASLLGEKV